MKEKISKAINNFQNSNIIRSIRNGLVNMIPILIIGAFSLVLMYFPITAYQNFIKSFANGFIYTLFDFIYSATFGVLSVYMTFSISRSYMKIQKEKNVAHGGAIFVSILCFFILAGALLPDFNLSKMGPKSMLLAIIAGLGASSLYVLFYKLFNRKGRYLLSRGADRELNKMLSTIFPIIVVSFLFALIDLIIIRIFKVESFHELYITMLNKLFSHGEASFFKGFFFVLLSSILWFFGVHGSDALEGVMENYFTPGLAINQLAIENGEKATEILTKEFFDCFVLMGGCGATICLLIAILIFSKNKSKKNLGYAASVPMLFNINELMVFGLPIIFSPIMLIPFLLTPLVSYSVAYLAISTGIVPMILNSVNWTTPVLIGGYFATGSIAGSFLQLFNILIGTLIYFPFVKLLDKQSAKDNEQNYKEFVAYYIENEQSLQNERIIELNSIYGDFAKDICAEIRPDLLKYLEIHYQPQYNYKNECVGVEALLRWKHPEYGYLYPPLVVKLMTECDMLLELEKKIVETVLNDKEKIYQKYGNNIKISINITGTTIIVPEFIEFMKEQNQTHKFNDIDVCIEITEKETLNLTEETLNCFRELKKMGLKLAIDDFSMGHTSIDYLKYNIFDIIKIDGLLVKGIVSSQNCREIISSISELSKSLKLVIIAEFVENEESKEILHGLGCDNYQGFLYSSAKPLE